ncbi:hypothetical protein BT63DRAFT_25722 [Microthyrium microscopicum]|uniref:Rhodopsin domain-containing protein n=1 Tax=Microthyrium microscopicum TaxID=703497 RepID=A0A6A6UVJ1_9PEZI|nr:hypothetical protein BT63DRAFT_25722 [Microthyrium microscopicum]
MASLMPTPTLAPVTNSTIPMSGPIPSGFFLNPFQRHAVHGQRDLTIIAVVITYLIPVFLVLVRICHPRRVRKYAPHDWFLFVSLFFAFCTTASLIASIILSVRPEVARGIKFISEQALKANIVSNMQFYATAMFFRMSLLCFAWKEFANRKVDKKRIVIFIQVVLIVFQVGVIAQGIAAMATSVASCKPISSAWDIRKFKKDCATYSQVQVINAGLDVWKDGIIMIGFILCYARIGINRSMLRRL